MYQMSYPTVSDVLRTNGFASLSDPSGLPKNVRKRRNKKIKRAAQNGPAGISALLGSGEYNEYINPTRFKKRTHKEKVSTRVSSLIGFSERTGPCGGWGRLPNVSLIDYADDDPRGWIHVGPHKRLRKCMISDESAE